MIYTFWLWQEPKERGSCACLRPCVFDIIQNNSDKRASESSRESSRRELKERAQGVSLRRELKERAQGESLRRELKRRRVVKYMIYTFWLWQEPKERGSCACLRPCVFDIIQNNSDKRASESSRESSRRELKERAQGEGLRRELKRRSSREGALKRASI